MKKSDKILTISLILVCIVLLINIILSLGRVPVTAKTSTEVFGPPAPTKLIVLNNKVPLTDSEQEFVQDLVQDSIFTPNLIYAIMKTESDFNVNAVSGTNDLGICQINRKYFKSYVDLNPQLYQQYNADPTHYFDFKTNTITCVLALNYWAQAKHTKDITLILDSYNQGFRIKNHNYSTKVLSNLKSLKE